MSIEVYGNTNIGRVRKINEDSFTIWGFDGAEDGFAVIADGMGGHNAGEIASAAAVDEIRRCLESSYKKDESVPKAITSAINSANRKIFEMSLSDDSRRGMGTTVIVTAVRGGCAYAANVGDSRIYLMHDGKLRQVTVDHSYVEELVASRSITREQAAVHPDRHKITRAVGTDPLVKADLFELEYSAGDIVLMCSDGLSDMLSPPMIEKTLARCEKVADAVDELIAEALRRGGIDNITIIGIRFF